MSLYPSLEDLKVDKVMKAQAQYAQTAASMPAIAEGTYQPQLATAGMPGSSLYPDLGELGDYMGLALNSEEVQRNLALLPVADNQVALPSLSGVGGMVRPVTGADVGIRRAEIRPGLREIILCKDQDGKDILTTSPAAMTITIMPKFVYEHMIKRMSTGLLRSAMDHSVPEV
uniref:Syndecan binding protein (syntenin) 2 n=1 Tax=Gasterosteus aculeatus aculeatus TaxID=481459 RepID=A0AAQ4Q109_GASAC